MVAEKKDRSGLIKVILLPGLLLLSIIILFSFFKMDHDEDNLRGKSIGEFYPALSLKLPDQLSFAGEMVPLENFDTRESLDRELLVNTYWFSQTLMIIKRANRYFPIIEPILRRNGIPDDFKYLAIAESGLTQAVSPSAAVGFWQFLKETAGDYNLEINDMIDERYHIEKSTEAACIYLKESYELYGNWTLVAASYNAGRNGINQQQDIQKEFGYYDLLLNEETARYVFRILAFKCILNNPQKYGFHVNEAELYPEIPTYKVVVDSSVDDFAVFARSYDINYKILKYFNPWLRKPYLRNPGKKKYAIKIPEKGFRDFPMYNQEIME